jgi:hypothetical protein
MEGNGSVATLCGGKNDKKGGKVDHILFRAYLLDELICDQLDKLNLRTKKPFCLNFSYACPEPVLVLKMTSFRINWLEKGVFRTQVGASADAMFRPTPPASAPASSTQMHALATSTLFLKYKHKIQIDLKIENPTDRRVFGEFSGLKYVGLPRQARDKHTRKLWQQKQPLCFLL